MSDKKIIDLEVKTNADKASKQFDNLSDSLDDASKSTNKLHEKFEDTYKDVEPLTTVLGEMEDKLYQMALAGEQNTEQFKELLTEVGKYRKTQIETDLTVDAAAMTMDQKLGGALQGAASGFAVVQGAMGLFGTESEEVEKALLRVNSAMALAQGISGLREGAKSFKLLGKTATDALTGIKSGIAATGIGLFIVALGLVVAKWDDIKKAVGFASKEQDAFNAIAESTGSEMANIFEQTTKVEMAFRQAKDGVISKKDALSIYNTTLGDALGTTDDFNDAESIFIQKTPAFVEASMKRIQAQELLKLAAQQEVEALKKTEEAEFGFFDKVVTVGKNFVTNFGNISKMTQGIVKDVEDDFGISNKKQAQSYKDLAADLLVEANNITKNFKINLDKRQSNNTTYKQTAEDLASDLLAFERRLEDLKVSQLEDSLRTQELKINLSYKRQREDILANIKYTEEQKSQLLFELEQNRILEQEKLLGIDDDAVLTPRDAKIIASNVEANKIILKNNKDNADEQKKIDEDLMQSKLAIAHAGLGAIGDLVNAMAGENEKAQKRAFNINKAVGIAQAVISTSEGIMKAFAQTTDFTPTQSFRIANAAVVAIAGAAQIATIAKQKFNATGGGNITTPSGGGSGSGTAPQPSFNVVGSSGINQLAQLQMQPTQAFVVSGDITTAQSLDRNKIENATL